MPSREQNRRLWSRYDWRTGGEEWSANWGTTAVLWYGTLMPRIAHCLGSKVAAVEIAPGHGRLTAFLKNYCESLVVVDLAANCVDFCKQRFRGDPHVRCFVNDGRSLPFLSDASVDFVFSFDSLVHADLQTLVDYLQEIRRVLMPGGHAVLHHSNLHSVLQREGSDGSRCNHLRAPDVSAELLYAAVQQLPGLQCRVQEIIPWDDTGRLIDCISSFIKRDTAGATPLQRFENQDFHRRAIELREIAGRYGQPGSPT